jgi:hypothetical protein
MVLKVETTEIVEIISAKDKRFQKVLEKNWGGRWNMKGVLGWALEDWRIG